MVVGSSGGDIYLELSPSPTCHNSPSKRESHLPPGRVQPWHYGILSYKSPRLALPNRWEPPLLLLSGRNPRDSGNTRTHEVLGLGGVGGCVGLNVLWVSMWGLILLYRVYDCCLLVMVGVVVGVVLSAAGGGDLGCWFGHGWWGWLVGIAPENRR